MLGFSLIRTRDLKQLRDLAAYSERFSTLHRWFSPYDWLMRPVWEFMMGKKQIDTARTDFLIRLDKKLDEYYRNRSGL